MRRIAVVDSPYNAETPMDRLDGHHVPDSEFFVRSHFEAPAIDPRGWQCRVVGAVVRPLSLDLAGLRGLTPRRLTVTLECAGNGRTLLRPAVPGAPWRLGAAGTAEFEGVALADVLARARPRADAVEVAFRGADEGEVGGGRRVRFERSLPMDVARHPDTLLAWTMNGRPLTQEHGAPVRLIVPGWYAVASVKWLVGIEALTEPFHGWFQGENYVYRGSSVHPENTPVTRMRVRAVVARPADGAIVPRGPLDIAGSAWSGEAPITGVALSVDGGATWDNAALEPAAHPCAATAWHARVTLPAPGPIKILARATDAAGNVQPLDAPWNRLGYGNNAAHPVRVTVA
jgi:DMSO/TMAO reductase YedYZ molybdopterin-dependent catalytic subunit